MNDPDLAEDYATESDPVVRMPRSMASLPPPPPGIPPRTVLLVGLLGALLGAGLGALGIVIVIATRVATAPALGIVRIRHHRHPFPAIPVQPPPGSAPPDGGVQRSSETPAETFETSQQAIGRGHTLAAVMNSLGVDGDDAVQAIRTLRPYVNLRALRPADQVMVLHDPVSHSVVRVEYHRSPTEIFAAVHSSDGTWRGERVEATLTTVRAAVGFRVQAGSVEASVRSAGLRAEILPRVLSVMPALDLPSHLAGGDVVRVLLDEDRINGMFYRYGRVYGLDYRGSLGHRRGYWLASDAHRGGWYDSDGQTFPRGPLRSPVPGARISSRFDPRRMHPVLHVIKPHNGMDFAAPVGTPVYCAAEGVVVWAGPAGPSGNLVRINHPVLGIQTGYAHLSAFAQGLRTGQRVGARQVIGYVGTTGRSTGPHLHFSVRRGGRFLDPEGWFGRRQGVTGAQREEFENEIAAEGDALDGVAVEGTTLRPRELPRDGGVGTREAPHGMEGGDDETQGDPGEEGNPEDDTEDPPQ